MVTDTNPIDDLGKSQNDNSSTEQDASDINDPSESTSSSRQVQHSDVKFPIKLHEMLMDVEKDENASIVSWNPDGKGFKVHKKKLFVERILSRYFSQTKYRSFQRQLNHYGFDRIPKGPFEGGYCHLDFVKDDPIRCCNMRRLKRTIIPTKLQLSTPPRDEGIGHENRNDIVAVSPEPSHRGSPNEGFEPRGDLVSAFQRPLEYFRPVPQYHRARIVTGAPVLSHPPGTQVYYHVPPPPPPPTRVTHVYYITSPNYHPSPYHQETSYPAVLTSPAPPSYQPCYAKATIPIDSALPPHALVLQGQEYNHTSSSSAYSFLCTPSPRRRLMGMVPVDDDEEVEAKRLNGCVETSTRRQDCTRLPSESLNQEKSLDDLLQELLSENDVENDEFLRTLTTSTGQPPASETCHDKYPRSSESNIMSDSSSDKTISVNNAGQRRSPRINSEQPKPSSSSSTFKLCPWEGINTVEL